MKTQADKNRIKQIFFEIKRLNQKIRSLEDEAYRIELELPQPIRFTDYDVPHFLLLKPNQPTNT